MSSTQLNIIYSLYDKNRKLGKLFASYYQLNNNYYKKDICPSHI